MISFSQMTHTNQNRSNSYTHIYIYIYTYIYIYIYIYARSFFDYRLICANTFPSCWSIITTLIWMYWFSFLPSRSIMPDFIISPWVMAMECSSCLYKLTALTFIWFGWILWHINHHWLFNAKSSLYIYIKYMIWLGWVLWHINYCRLFNAKSFLYIYQIFLNTFCR